MRVRVRGSLEEVHEARCDAQAAVGRRHGDGGHVSVPVFARSFCFTDHCKECIGYRSKERELGYRMSIVTLGGSWWVVEKMVRKGGGRVRTVASDTTLRTFDTLAQLGPLDQVAHVV